MNPDLALALPRSRAVVPGVGARGGASPAPSHQAGLGVDLSAVLDAVARVVTTGSAEASAGEPVRGRTPAVPEEGSQRARVEAIRALEDLKDAACAVQAELSVAVVDHEVAVAESVSADADRDAKSPSRARSRRVAQARRSAIGQVALARRESPHRGGVLVGMAEALVGEMPCTLAALRTGALNEFRATLLVRETASVDREARAEVDRAICGDPRTLAGLGTRRLVAAVQAVAYRADPHGIVRRAERDAGERCVTLRPAPGSMTYLTALVPLAQGVAMLANLQRTAEAARAAGEERSKGQIMADTLVERVTGQASADAVPVMVNLVMSDATLLAAGHQPAVLDGANQVPAQLARDLVARALAAEPAEPAKSAEPAEPAEPADPSERAALADPRSAPHPGGFEAMAAGNDDEARLGCSPSGRSPRRAGFDHETTGQSAPGAPSSDRRRQARKVGAWVRRLYADAGGDLVAMDSRSRTFPAGMAALLRVRDQGLCRTPWCDAPVAHLDHVTPVVAGGPTSARNGQGLCAGCNYTKQAPGWTQRATHEASGHGVPGHEASAHEVWTTTPTGREYVSRAAPVPEPISLTPVARSSSGGDVGLPVATAASPTRRRVTTTIELYVPHRLEPALAMLRHAA